MSPLSIFAAAREAPERPALLDGARSYTFAELAELSAPRAAALRELAAPALALAPRAELDSLLWLYAAFASGMPVLTLHARAPHAEQARALALTGAAPPPAAAKLGAPSAFEEPALELEAPLAYVPTSGSTGAPRISVLSRRAVLASAQASAQNLGWQAGDRWLACLPLSHTGGLSIVLRTLIARRTLVVFEPGDAGLLARAAELSALLESHAISLVSLVPSLLGRLLDLGFRAPPALRAVLLGGAGCAPALAERARAARLPLLTSYGLTETASQVVTRRYAERFESLPTSSGCVSSGHALAGVELELRGGRIAVRSPALFSGYLGDDAPALDPEGWLITSDLGELGEDGALFVRGRSDDVIVSGGENVDPLEVEAALSALPEIEAACVFGVASAEFGQLVAALLVTRDPAAVEPGVLGARLAGQLARYKHPRSVACVERLPLTASGKPDRRACAAEHARLARARP